MWPLLVLLLQLSSAPCQEMPRKTVEHPSVVVQLVDPMWLPISNADVAIQSTEKRGTPFAAEQTDSGGYARFELRRAIT